MKSKSIRSGFWAITTVIVIAMSGYVIRVRAFDIFRIEDSRVLALQCDPEWQRQAELYRLEGNAVTNPAIHLRVYLDCDSELKTGERAVFTVEGSALADTDVTVRWLSFDTLAVQYRKGLNVFRRLDSVVYKDRGFNFHVHYSELDSLQH